MTALSAGSLTYTVSNQRRLGNSKVFNKVKILFASGQTYPTGGLLIGTGATTASGYVGCPNVIESMVISDEGTSGYNFNYNTTSLKLQMFYPNVSAVTTGTVQGEVASTVTPGALVIYVDVIGW